ncbi:hypothetical protein VNO78_22074 [Psophocarpus tetragonolobus]|uniref:Cupin type-1 domain-containing protein n=1 Tax=Psophocarpus tetragonolobus TaxID=3891 RepID=A0AAN9XIQ5_PSOTE
MAITTNFSLTLFFFFFFFFFFLFPLFSNLGLAQVEDPELKTCKHQCLQQHQYSQSDQQQCLQSCELYHHLKQEREKQIEEETPKKKDHSHYHQHQQEEESRERQEEEQEKQEEEDDNPYIFEDSDFHTKVQTEGGRIRVLKNFTQNSKLLQGIQNLRLAILEARPHTFVSPRHFDSDVVLFNMMGRALLGLVKESQTEKFILERGDMMPIPAGTPLYIVNREEREKLFLAMLHIPVSTPGKFEEFFGPGGQDPESVLSAFSQNVLQAALQSPIGKLERLFNQQNEGSIFKISKEQVQALAPRRSYWRPFSGPSRPEFNLFNRRTTYSNEYGRLTEVGPADDKDNLDRLNLMLTLANISQESMSTIHYNSHATKIAVVIDGRGFVQIVCPHVSKAKHEKSGPSYHRISSELKPGKVFVVPQAHPFVLMSSKGQNLLVLCFEINARDNKKFTFAGKDNIVSSLDDNAKELAFNYPSDLVNKIFNRKETFFFPLESPSEERADA